VQRPQAAAQGGVSSARSTTLQCLLEHEQVTPPCMVHAAGSGSELLAALRASAAAQLSPAATTTVIITASMSLQGLGLPRHVPPDQRVNITHALRMQGV
jgi:hypothetical protein